MDLKFSVAARIAKPVEEVYEAVVNPDQLSGYFTTGGAKGRIEKGATVMWSYHDFPGEFPVQVIEAIPNEKIVLDWEATDEAGIEVDKPGAGYNIRMTMEFKPLEDGRTLVTINERGWHSDQDGLQSSYGNCEGWTQMLCSLKAWMEHGINLREGFYQ
ncbi:SRPBCC family protein [Parasphingorhabdus sp.]|uniref:SRPBCC family protein n=1 Tax=Parasphingorhabdus sp. TaxID=2709688 RepID=UPI003264FFDD